VQDSLTPRYKKQIDNLCSYKICSLHCFLVVRTKKWVCDPPVMNTGSRVINGHSSPKFSIVPYYFTRRCANYKITAYFTTYWHALRLSCGTQRYPINGFPPSSTREATAIVNICFGFMYRVLGTGRTYRFPSKIIFIRVSPEQNPGSLLKSTLSRMSATSVASLRPLHTVPRRRAKNTQRDKNENKGPLGTLRVHAANHMASSVQVLRRM
jgi:hypothetical protein